MSWTPLGLHSRRRAPYLTYCPVLEQLETRRLLSTSVLTAHNDAARTGANLTETTLTLDNVNASTFGKLYSYPVDGQVYAQPLYMPNVTLPNGSVHNIVYVVTEHDTAYAFDANGGGLLKSVSLIDASQGQAPFTTADAHGCTQITPEIGITGTPVIDPNTNIGYVVDQFRQVQNGVTTYHQQLHAVDVTTGHELPGSPVEIQATFGSKTFDPQQYKERPGLLLLNGVVWTTWSSHCDINPAPGWVIGYDAQTLQQVGVFNTAATGNLNTIWQGGGGPAADADGNFYVETGNGTHNPAQNDFSEAFVKFTPGGDTGVTASDYFSPSNWQSLDNADRDIGSGGPLALPDQPGPYPHELIGAGKDGRIFVLNRDNLGGDGSTDDGRVIQELPDNTIAGGSWDTPAYFDGGDPNGPWIYYAGNGDKLKAFQLTNGLLSTSPTSQSSASFSGNYGATPSISADGTANGIVWAIQKSGPVLRAYNAYDLTQELFDSNQGPSSNRLPAVTKFAVPTIADGEVFVGTNNSLEIYGLLPQATVAANKGAALVTAPASTAAPLALPAGTTPVSQSPALPLTGLNLTQGTGTTPTAPVIPVPAVVAAPLPSGATSSTNGTDPLQDGLTPTDLLA
jgi:hypothetical protein